jgi:hypothetical protein
MGILNKLSGAITFWTDPYARRTGILNSCLAYAGGLTVIGERKKMVWQRSCACMPCGVLLHLGDKERTESASQPNE